MFRHDAFSFRSMSASPLASCSAALKAMLNRCELRSSKFLSVPPNPIIIIINNIIFINNHHQYHHRHHHHHHNDLLTLFPPLQLQLQINYNYFNLIPSPFHIQFLSTIYFTQVADSCNGRVVGENMPAGPLWAPSPLAWTQRQKFPVVSSHGPEIDMSPTQLNPISFGCQ